MSDNRRARKGAPAKFVELAVAYDGDDCLMWPYSKFHTGYGKINDGGKTKIVSRVVCKRVNGEPPTPEHHAAHSCANGHLGCITPRHLSWKTAAQNNQDIEDHGHRPKGEALPHTKLTPQIVRAIRDAVAGGENPAHCCRAIRHQPRQCLDDRVPQIMDTPRMSDNRPITFRRDGDTLVPFGLGMKKRFDEYYVDGELYRLAEPIDRTQSAEGFYFANLKEIWHSLPEKYADQWWSESVDALRAYALMKTGFANIEDFPCKSAGEAERWAARLRPMIDYCIVEIRGSVVRRYTPKSQSRKAMPGRATFAESSNKVLGFAADLVGLAKDAPERTAT